MMNLNKKTPLPQANEASGQTEGFYEWTPPDWSECGSGADAVAALPAPAGEEAAVEGSAEANDEAGQAIAAVQARNLAKRSDNRSTYVVLGCIAALLALTVLGSVMNVGDHLGSVHPVLGWVFYGLLAVVVTAGIVVPLVRVARRPIFSLYQLRDEQGHAKKRYCRLLADNLIANADLTPEEIAQVEAAVAAGDEADDRLIEFFEARIVPALDEETKRTASTAFFISAISRSPLVSTVTMLSLCLDLVRAIVEKCGFRPTNLGLARLYSRVMLSALIVGGIEDSDLSELLGQMLGGGAGGKAGGIVLGAAAEGLVSAFLVFRVGIITRRWLTSEDGPAHMRALRRASYKEALTLMRESGFVATVTETLKQTTGSAASAVASSVAGAAKDAAHATADAASSKAHEAVDAMKAAAHRAREAMGLG